MKQLAFLALLAFVCVTGLLFLFQRSLLYPARAVEKTEFLKEVARRFGRGTQLLEPFDAVVIDPTPGKKVVGTAVLFHGNGELGIDRTDLVGPLEARGFRVILAEYPGYGARGGRSTEEAIVNDAIRLYRTVRARYGQEAPLIVGVSLGSGVAVQVATRVDASEAPPRLVLLTPYLSIAKTAALKFPYLPARYLVLDRFDSERALPRYTGFVAVGVADRDEVVGAAQGYALAEVAQARGPTQLVVFHNAGHNDWSGRVTDAQWQQLLAY